MIHTAAKPASNEKIIPTAASPLQQQPQGSTETHKNMRNCKGTCAPYSWSAPAQSCSDLLSHHCMALSAATPGHHWQKIRTRGSWTSGLAQHGSSCAPISGTGLLQTPMAPFETSPFFKTPGDEEATHSFLVKVVCPSPVCT